MLEPRTAPATVRWAAASLLVAVMGGCGSISSSPTPESARVHMESADASAVDLVTSVLFSVRGGGVELLEADTQRVSLPFDDDFTLSEAQRFYVSVAPVEAMAATLHMRVWIDGESWYDSTRPLGGEEAGSMEFVYRFTQPVIR